MCITVTMPIHIVSESNQRDHWATKHLRVQGQRQRRAGKKPRQRWEMPNEPG